MKSLNIYLSCFFILLTCSLRAQHEPTPPSKEKSLIIKTNLLTPFSLGTELALGQHLSLSASVIYVPEFQAGDADGDFALLKLEKPGMGFTGALRYYPRKDKSRLTGFYPGIFGSYREFHIGGQKNITLNYAESETTLEVQTSFVPKMVTGGVMIGWQKIAPKGFTFDFNMGIGYFQMGGIPKVTVPSDVENSERINKILSMRSGVAPKLSLALGYAF